MAEDFDYRCKQSGQLASKMRFLSVPWLGLLENNTWLKNAIHANECAKYLENRLQDIPPIQTYDNVPRAIAQRCAKDESVAQPATPERLTKVDYSNLA